MTRKSLIAPAVIILRGRGREWGGERRRKGSGISEKDGREGERKRLCVCV